MSGDVGSESAANARIAWRCRRGLLELDLVFARFLATGYTTLTAAERAAFTTLLTEPDAVLLEWIQGAPAPARYASLVARLRTDT